MKIYNNRLRTASDNKEKLIRKKEELEKELENMKSEI